MTAGRSDERERPVVIVDAIAAAMGGFFVFVVLVAIGLFMFYQALARDATFVKPGEIPTPQLQTRSDGCGVQRSRRVLRRVPDPDRAGDEDRLRPRAESLRPCPVASASLFR